VGDRGGIRGIAAAGLCLCALALLCVTATRPRPPSPQPPSAKSLRTLQPRSPSAQALWQARLHRMSAVDAANRERYPTLEASPLEASPPEVTLDQDTESWRRELMARDSTGELRRARQAVYEAVRLARTPTEEYQARTWAVLITCDAGDHRQELQHARRLVELQPGNEISLTSLRRAARCNGRAALAREAGAALAELQGRQASKNRAARRQRLDGYDGNGDSPASASDKPAPPSSFPSGLPE
jgi:hypothetical protein